MNNKKIIFLDKASTTEVYRDFFEYIIKHKDKSIGNPSSIHTLGQNSRSFLESQRRKICKILNISTYQLIFTSGSTEGNNLIIQQNFDYYITTNTSHSSIWNPILKKYKNKLIICPNKRGEPLLDKAKEFAQKLLKFKVLWIFEHVNSTTGFICNTNKIIKAIKSIAPDHKILIDETQAICKIKVLSYNFGADYCTFSGHKFKSIKGIGGIIFNLNSIEDFETNMIGGGQEFNRRAGTENIIGISSMFVAFRNKYKNFQKNKTKIMVLDQYFMKEIVKRNLSVLTFDLNRLPGIFNINYDNISKIRNDLLCIKLNENNICVSPGSACSSGSLTQNRIINNILETKNFRQHIRVSFDEENSIEELKTFWKEFDKIILNSHEHRN